MNKQDFAYSSIFIILICNLYGLFQIIFYSKSFYSAFLWICGCVAIIYLIVYLALRFINESCHNYEESVIKMVVGDILIKGKKDDKHINWNAISSLIACFAILISSITGFLSIKLSVDSVEISKDMKILAESAFDIQNSVVCSGVLMDENIIFSSESFMDGNVILSNFYDYFYILLGLPDEMLESIARIHFLESQKDNEYFKIKYDIYDDNIIYVIKFYLTKFREKALDNDYFNTLKIAEIHCNKIDLFERRFLLMGF